MAGADLRAARLRGVNLTDTDLRRANLSQADLREAVAVGTNPRRREFDGCEVYGIAAWNVGLRGGGQRDLLITPEGEHGITTDNLAVAQFLYLLLHNENIRDVIETVGRKVVLILGRFTVERKAVLDVIRNVLREHNLVPVLCDFEGPRNRI